MEGVVMLIFLSITMLIGSLIAGLLPLALTLSETKMRHITIIGAGLLIGTALAVIIPEGIHTLYSSDANHVPNNIKAIAENLEHNHGHGHNHKRSLNEANQGDILNNVLESKNYDDLRGKQINKRSIQTDQEKLNLYLVQQTEGNNNLNTVLKRLSDDDKDLNRDIRNKRDAQVPNKLDDVDKQRQLNPPNSIDAKENPNKPINKDAPIELGEKDFDDTKSENAHSAIGVTLVLGFVFMLIVDQIGGKISHRPHQIVDNQSIRNKITFSTTLGLVVHAAADGIALGAAAATSKTDVEMIVFVAIMLHKAPAAFGLVSFLIHEGLERARVRKHLVIFALAAPVMAIVTFIILKSQNKLATFSSDSTGLCMLFSAGTFLYVSTIHVLPEVQAHNDDRQFRFSEMISFISGAILPLFLSVGHSH